LAAAFAGLRGEDRKRESTDKNAMSLLFILKAQSLTYNLELLHIHS
jgi:hypothetical protein